MARPRKFGTGTVAKTDDGRWCMRFRWRDERGVQRGVRRIYLTATAAKEDLDRIVAEVRLRGSAAIDAEKRTLGNLLDAYEAAHCHEPVTRAGLKVAGLRSWRDARSRLAVLRTHFGSGLRLQALTRSDILSFKAARLSTPTRYGRERSIAAVNRDLELLRRVLNFAVGNGWIEVNPFRGKPAIISLSAEPRRDRVLTVDEEARLLEACTGRRAQLRPLVVVAVETGCRRGELFKLRWSDVDLDARRLTVRAENSKVERTRSVPLSIRAGDALAGLFACGKAPDPNALVFGYRSTPKTAWAGACRAAGIEGLRFHDLRSTCGTRLAERGVDMRTLAEWLGHSDTKTTFRFYVGRSESALDSAVEALDRPADGEANADMGRVN